MLRICCYNVQCFVFCLLLVSTGGVAQFAPPVDQVGSDAIQKDSSIISAWASGITVQRGFINIKDTTATHNGSNYASFGVQENALGPVSGTSSAVVSLGDGGSATLTFEHPIKNGLGPDFCVFENSFSDTYLELAFVEVSSNGIDFVRFPSHSLTQTEEQVGGFGSLDATKLYNFAGKYRQGYGVPFDLEELKDSSNVNTEAVTHVRIIDVVGSIDPAYATYDSYGNKVNDPFPSPFDSGGFDLDGVGVIHQNTATNHLKNVELPIHIYPNPARQYLHVNSPNAQLALYSISGKLVHEQKSESELTTLTIEHLPAGIYYLGVSTATKNQRFKVIIE